MTSVPTRPTTTPRDKAPARLRARSSATRATRIPGTTLVLHWGGPRHGEVAPLPEDLLASSTLVYDGPKWFGVYERFQPVRKQATAQGSAEVWVVRE
jgi:hypothetical protein